MKKSIQRIGKFYTRVVMKNIGIFIFIGLLSVVFNDYGWLPNKNMYALSQFAYYYILPVMVAYAGGQAAGGQFGGILAVLGMCGLVSANENIGLFGAMIFGPLGGMLWKYEQELLEEKAASNMQMLWKNLGVGISGGILASGGFYIIAPFIQSVMDIVRLGIRFLVDCNLMWMLSVVIEPAKVFFMNNVINHGILIPLGMDQTAEFGKSCLFLLETNPGPGAGLLAALWYVRAQRREEYASALLAQAAGGIHEVYFPFVLADMWLLIPLILGGMAGGICFELLQGGLQSAVSPGSFISILILAGKDSMGAAAAGMLVSAVVSFAGSVIYLKTASGKQKEQEAVGKEPELLKHEEEPVETVHKQKKEELTEKEPEMAGKRIQKIGFVCEGGMGSSAMGAAIFRRTLAKHQLTGIQVEVFSADLIEGEVDLIVCQEDFYRVAQDDLKEKKIYTVESFLKAEEYERLISDYLTAGEM